MRLSLLSMIAVLVLFTSCDNTVSDKKSLSVSIEPQRYFLEKIVGDKYDVNVLMQAGSSPESYDPTPSQMLRIGKSSLFFKIGYLGFENNFLKSIKENNPDLNIIDCSTGIQTIEEDEHGHEGHGHEGGINPHIWSSPKTASKIAENMYKAIISLDAENKDYYDNNYKKLTSDIDSVDNIIRGYIEKASVKSFIVYHPALNYFAQEYGLTQYCIEHEGKSPSPAQLKSLIDMGKEKGIQVVFIQEEYDTKNAEVIAKEIGAKVVPINLLSYNWGDEMIKIARSLSSNDE